MCDDCLKIFAWGGCLFLFLSQFSSVFRYFFTLRKVFLCVGVKTTREREREKKEEEEEPYYHTQSVHQKRKTSTTKTTAGSTTTEREREKARFYSLERF